MDYINKCQIIVSKFALQSSNDKLSINLKSQADYDGFQDMI